jgi:spermidine synthase
MLLYPVESLDYVELDQKLMDITGKYLSSADRRALADKRVTLFHQDGRYYIKNIRGKKQYDVILVNVPDPSTAFLNRFYTFEFFKEIEAVLNPDGVLATSVSSAVTYIGKEVGSYTGSLYHTLHKIFRHVLVTPGQTNYYFASNADGIVSFDIATLMKRYRECHIKSDYFNEYLFYTLLQPEQVSFIEQQLGKRKDLLVNTDKRPVTYFLNLVLWDSLTGGRLHGIFYRLQNTGLLVFLIPVFIAVAGRVIYTFMHGNFKLPKGEMSHSVPHDNKVILSDSEESDLMRQTKRHSPYHAGKFRTDCLVVLAIAGFTGLSLEIVLIYAFQNIYGYMYERVGVIVAVFMVGLALGGYVMNRLIRMSAYRLSEQSLNRKWIKILALFELGAGLYAIILPAIIQACSSYSVTAGIGLVCLVGVTGILTGFVFPLINAILIQSGKAIAVSAGATNSADHIGAFFGALLAGVFFIPIFGVWGTCLILSALNISGFVLITISALCLKGEPDVKE